MLRATYREACEIYAWKDYKRDQLLCYIPWLVGATKASLYVYMHMHVCVRDLETIHVVHAGVPVILEQPVD